MKRKIKFKFFVLFIISLLFLANANVSAANISYMPTNNFYVNDFANLLNSQTENTIMETSKQIEKITTAQVVVVTIQKMNGMDIESYANQLFNKWGIGQADKDNGVLLIISKSERKVRIEVGYGLEGAINDAKAGRILDNLAVPYLKSNDYDTAVLNVVKELQGVIYNEYNIEGGFDNYDSVSSNSPSDIIIFLIALIPVFIYIILRIFIYKGKRNFWDGPFSGGGFSRWWRLLGRRWLIWGRRCF